MAPQWSLYSYRHCANDRQLYPQHHLRRGWRGWVDASVLMLPPCCFHVVTGCMGCLCSPETIWMCLCVCISTADGLPLLFFWIQSIHRWDLKQALWIESPDPITTTAGRGHTEMHKARILTHSPSVWWSDLALHQPCINQYKSLVCLCAQQFS